MIYKVIRWLWPCVGMFKFIEVKFIIVCPIDKSSPRPSTNQIKTQSLPSISTMKSIATPTPRISIATTLSIATTMLS